MERNSVGKFKSIKAKKYSETTCAEFHGCDSQTLNLAEATGFATGSSDSGSCSIWAMGLVCVTPLP